MEAGGGGVEVEEAVRRQVLGSQLGVLPRQSLDLGVTISYYFVYPSLAFGHVM